MNGLFPNIKYVQKSFFTMLFPFFLFNHTALQEPLVDSDAGQPGDGAAILVEEVLLRKACCGISPSKALKTGRI